MSLLPYSPDTITASTIAVAEDLDDHSPKDLEDEKAQNVARDPLDASTKVISPRQLRRYNLGFAGSTFAIGPAFGCANTYMSFQIQQLGFVLGHNPGMPEGSGCLDLTLACRVPFGAQSVNLTSVLLYLTAICYAVSGFLTLLICSWGDYMDYKREQYVGFLVLYGAICLPTAALTSYSLSNYNAIAVLYTLFNIIGFVAGAWMNVFVPYVMQQAVPKDNQQTTAIPDGHAHKLRREREEKGVQTSVWGGAAMNIGMVALYLVAIGVTYANADSSANAGLYMTTAAGGICIIFALGSLRFLPIPPPKLPLMNKSFWSLPYHTFVELFQGVYKYPEAFKFLAAFIIYNDSIFAFSTVTSALFNLSIRPDLREYTAYSTAGAASSIFGSLAFLYLFPRLQFSLRQWALLCYGTIVLVTAWCLLGMINKSPIGFKHRAEFYVFQVIQNIATAILTALFRVLFPEMFPKGSEIRYFGFQSVLSLATVWIPQIVNGPIVDATNNQRLPAVIALVFVIIAFGLTWWMDDVKGVDRIRHEELHQVANGKYEGQSR